MKLPNLKVGFKFGLLIVPIVISIFSGCSHDASDQLDQPEIKKPAAISNQVTGMERILALREQLHQQPEDTAARYQLGLELRAIDVNLALAEFEKIGRDADESFLARKQMAAIYLLQQAHEQAEVLLLELHQEHSQDFAVELSLAELYFNQDRFQEALTHGGAAVQLEPDKLEILILQAAILEGMGRYVEMLPVLDSILVLHPDQYEAHSMRAFAYQQVGETSKADQEIEWCLQRDDSNAFVHQVAAATARDAGQLEKAMSHARMSIELDPDNIDAYILVADLLMYQQQPEEAYQFLMKIYEAGQTELRYLGAFARSAAASGHADEALVAYQKIDQIYRRQMELEKVDK